jgi:hypothetical protein
VFEFLAAWCAPEESRFWAFLTSSRSGSCRMSHGLTPARRATSAKVMG